MRHNLIALSIALGVLSLGCAEERLSPPLTPARMSATPISTKIVVDLSESVNGQREGDSVFTLDFGTASSFTNGKSDDIYLRFNGVGGEFPASIDIYKPSRDEWIEVPGAYEQHWGPCIDSDCWAWTYRLLSELGIQTATHFIDSLGQVRVRAPGVINVRGNLITYDDSYHFAKVTSETVTYGGGLSYWGGALYYSTLYVKRESPTLRDSVFSMDLEGRRLRALSSGTSSVVNGPAVLSKSAFDGRYFWTMRSNHLYVLDTNGQVASQYDAPVGRVYGMAHGHGRVWFVPTSYPDSLSVYSILPESTAVVGSLVSQKMFTLDLPNPSIDAITTDSSGFIVAHEDLLYRFSLSGELRDIIQSPVTLISGLAWDGDSLWVLHHGPPEAPTDATLLSRFTLE